MQLEDKSIIVTGASGGIGAAAALMFAGEGAGLVLGGRRENELRTISDQINRSNGRATFLVGDVGDEGYLNQQTPAANRPCWAERSPVVFCPFTPNTAGILNRSNT